MALRSFKKNETITEGRLQKVNVVVIVVVIAAAVVIVAAVVESFHSGDLTPKFDVEAPTSEQDVFTTVHDSRHGFLLRYR